MIDINELRQSAQAATPGPWMIDYVGVGFEVAAGESVIAQSQQVQGDMRHKARKANAAFIAAANPATVLELLDNLKEAEKERDELRAKIEAMERQEPVGTVQWIKGWPVVDAYEGVVLEPDKPLYALPGAQPAPSVPDVDALAQFIREVDGSHQLGAGVLAERIAEWLKAAPEANQ